MAFIKPCPKCQNPLDIPQPAPDMIVCPKCGVNIKKKAPKAGSLSATPMPPRTLDIPLPMLSNAGAAPVASSRRWLLLLLLLAGMSLLACLPITGIAVAWYLSNTNNASSKE